ncbi:hypothetical protein QR680_006686 [Steinernema hermaphroditum]|uniref:Ephrin RBD domain-containing protein n=1 Tax=Steinernema hermaphroditum TaxID=289476 RepID=A0AA39HXT4_9BILA|nr:hypothetical protein QR680_006686 [Steinernema hermaphroditum]
MWFSDHKEMNINILTLIHSLLFLWRLSLGRQLPDLIWSSQNSLFKQGAIVEVEMFDELTIKCPTKGSNNSEFSRIFMVSDMAYLNCLLDSSAKLFMECDKPREDKNRKVVFRPYSPTPEGLEFVGGKSYYLISTSNGTLSGIDSRQNGLCSSANMRLKIDVHAEDLSTMPEVNTARASADFQISDYNYDSFAIQMTTEKTTQRSIPESLETTKSPYEEANQRNLDLNNFKYVLSLAQHGTVGSISFKGDRAPSAQPYEYRNPSSQPPEDHSTFPTQMIINLSPSSILTSSFSFVLLMFWCF